MFHMIVSKFMAHNDRKFIIVSSEFHHSAGDKNSLPVGEGIELFRSSNHNSIITNFFRFDPKFLFDTIS